MADTPKHPEYISNIIYVLRELVEHLAIQLHHTDVNARVRLEYLKEFIEQLATTSTQAGR